MPYKLIQQKVGTMHVADTLTAGSAVGYGTIVLGHLDLIVSILAGVLVGISAGFSIYLHWQEHKARKKAEQEQNTET